MRPVDKGPSPGEFEDYRDAKEDLATRLGLYCSYCERRIPTLLAVEHVQPKSLHPDLATTWDNLLLGCTNCNSTKGDKPVARESLILPDQDNSFLAFRYETSGAVFPAAGLPPEAEAKATATLSLTGLNRFPHPDDFPDDAEFEAALERWQQRSLTHTTAAEAFEILATHDKLEVRELITKLALAAGFLSVWMHVFSSDKDMRVRLVNAPPGTSTDCFDANGSPIPRPNGHL